MSFENGKMKIESLNSDVVWISPKHFDFSRS